MVTKEDLHEFLKDYVAEHGVDGAKAAVREIAPSLEQSAPPPEPAEGEDDPDRPPQNEDGFKDGIRPPEFRIQKDVDRGEMKGTDDYLADPDEQFPRLRKQEAIE